MLTRIGLSSVRAFSSASDPHGNQSTGLSLCWSRYGLVSFARRFAKERSLSVRVHDTRIGAASAQLSCPLAFRAINANARLQFDRRHGSMEDLGGDESSGAIERCVRERNPRRDAP